MSRDIEDRLREFVDYELGDADFTVSRIALNWDQVQAYNPPPNPAKITDSRAKKYINNFGDESWELDALEPSTIDQLITSELSTLIDWDRWDDDHDREKREKAEIKTISDNYTKVVEFLQEAQ